jgi:outer membrane protein TolC
MDKLRGEWPALPGIVIEGDDVLRIPLDEAFTKVSQVALTNRLDLMNARAQVVDAYRQVAVRANALQGAFDVRYDLTTNTSPAEASLLGFSGGRTRHQLTLRTDLPIVRQTERNQYRAALISYQRQRRLLMAFEDNVLTDTRQDLRQLRQTAETLKLNQRAVELAFAQVDNARATLLAPPDPRVSDNAGGPAALTEQLLNAQDGLVQAQNNLYTAWVNFLTARMELYLDLDLLPLDPRGVWIDDLAAQPGPDSPPLPPGSPAPGGGR